MTEVRFGAPSAFSRCPNCGEPSPGGDRYCRACGQAMDPNVISKPTEGRGQDDPWASIVRRLRALVGNEFQIVRELGRGGMAAVYLAYEAALDRNVAMKIMSPALLTGAGMIERFQREARTVAKLVHPNIVALHAVRQIEDLHFFTMQFVEGRSLDRIIHDAGPLPIRTIRSLLFTIGNALGYAHRRGVVHRDVKPANILINDEGSAVVTDFGIAKVAQDTSGPNTQTNALVGTPAYISPEQCYGHSATEASDQYSLGILAYELLTGHVPFSGTPFVVLQAHTEKPVPSLRARRADCPEDLEAAVMRMLEKNPANRWPTMQHALAELGAVVLPEGDPEQIALARLAVPDGTGRVQDMRWTPARPQNEVRAERPVTPPPAPYVAAIAILAPPESVEIGDTITLVAAARNAAGETMPGIRFSWTVDNSDVASVDSARGEVKALAAGDATITATAGGVSKSVHLVVTPRKVTAVKISLPPGSLRVGDSIQLVAKAEDKSQAPVAEGIHWMSGDAAIAEVSEDGILLARNSGMALVWAEAQGVRASARVQINPAPVTSLQISAPPSVEVGEGFQLRATPLGPRGETLSDRPLSWRSSDPKVALISQSGAVETHAPGRAKLTCACEAREASVLVAVSAPATARIAIAHSNENPTAGDSIKLEAQAFSRRELPIERKFRWTVSPPGLAKISRHGEITTLAPGTVTVTASTEDGDASIQLEVAPPPLPVAPVLPEPASPVAIEHVEKADIGVAADVGIAIDEPKRGRRPLIALGAGAVVVAGLAIGLIARGPSSNAAITRSDTVEQPAPATAVVPKTEPTAPDLPKGADVPPKPALVTKIAMRGIPARVIVGDAFTLSAETRDANGEILKPSSLRWTSTAPSVATIDRATGRFTAKSDGRTMIIVEADGAKEMTAVTVVKAVADAKASEKLPPAVRTIAISTADTVMSVGDGVTLPATRSGPASSTPVLWESDRTSVARVDQQGRVTGVSPGIADITARWEGAHGSIHVVVKPAAVANVAVAPPSGPIVEGQQLQLQATTVDSRNSQLTGRDISWRSENPDLASVSATGVVNALHAGTAAIVATSEGRSGRVVVQITARQVAKVERTATPPTPSPATPSPAPAIDKSIEDFVKALNAHSEAAVRAVVDDETWKQLENKVGRSESKLRAQPASKGNVQTNESQATVDFSVPLDWISNAGRRRNSTGAFRATLTFSGNAWTLQRITLTNRID